MPISNFHSEYKKVKDAMEGKSFADPIKTAMTNLAKCLEESGPKVGTGPKLDALRTALKGDEANNVLKGAGLNPGQNVCPTQDVVDKVATIKFLRHMYLLDSTGAQTVWVHSTPEAWRKYGWDEIHDAGGSSTSLKTKLGDATEFFDSGTRTKLATATRLGFTWVQKALVVLGEVKTKAEAKAKLDRWFAPAATDVDSTVDKLERGFKKIQATLNDTAVVLTDHLPDRGKTDKQYTEAYVLVAEHKPKTIYIEQALAKNFDVSVLHDMKKNWARVIVHECSHLDVDTDDERYAYRGIKPGDKITAAQALNNADSWAFFAADCGGALVAGDITRALAGTGGSLTELATNWN